MSKYDKVGYLTHLNMFDYDTYTAQRICQHDTYYALKSIEHSLIEVDMPSYTWGIRILYYIILYSIIYYRSDRVKIHIKKNFKKII